MLGTLLEKLGTLLPKNFIISSFFPVLIFAFLNALLCYVTSAACRRWFDEYGRLDTSKQALYGVPILIGVAVLAYIFSTFSLYLRQLLEGDYLPERLSRRMIASQRARLMKLQELLDEYGRKRFDLRVNQPVWQARLKEERRKGYEAGAPCGYTAASVAAVIIEELRLRRSQHEWIEFQELEAAADSLGRELASCQVDNDNPRSADARNRDLLNKDQNDLLALVDYALGKVNNRYLDLYNEREFNFSRYKVAPTALGNIAESINSYALTRYSINLEAFWSRLQKVIQGDDKFYATLLDAKTQLDFLIALFWMTAAFTATWFFILLFAGASVLAFLVVALAGPLLCVLFYKLALQNYLAFADTLRTSVDIYRLDLLKALHVQLPDDMSSECQTWEDLNRIIGYGQRKKVLLKHPQPDEAHPPST